VIRGMHLRQLIGVGLLGENISIVITLYCHHVRQEE
jgi:hypothetical protein